MNKKMLVIVDYQKDFVDGALGFAGAELLDEGIAKKVKEYLGRGDYVVATLDTHQADYLETREGKALPVPHCIEGTPGWELYGLTGDALAFADCIKVKKRTFGVAPPYIGVIYGDAITHDAMINIYSRLAGKGYAANNVVLGFGSYTYQYVTRDTFGFALKVTHGIIDGEETFMFKDPITDRGANSAGKKSQKGMCIVKRDTSTGDVSYTDQHYMEEADAAENLLRPIFKNGELLADEDFYTIRHRLNPDF